MKINLVQKVALPLLLSSVVIALLLLYITPQRQQSAIEESAIAELQGLAAAFAVSAQLAFANQDLTALAQLNTLVAENPKSLRVAVYLDQAPGEVLLAAFPDPETFLALLDQENNASLRATSTFQSGVDAGRIEILYPRNMFDDEIGSLNNPLFLVMAAFIAIQLWVYLILAWQVVNPLVAAAKFADRLGAGAESDEYEHIRRSDEVGLLQRSLQTLQARLSRQRRENEELLASLESKVLKRTEELEAALVAKDSFLSSVSHELRTPLHSIIASLGLMEKQGVPDESQSRYLSLASKGSDALMKLINELLDYQRFGQTDIQLYPEPIALKSGITSSYESMRPLFANSGVDFVLELKVPEDLVVKLDNNRLTQVLNNLVGNAKKFTASGCVVLRLEVADINHKTAELSFSVTDTGSGMDEATLARLGEAFFQAEEGYRKSHQGTGLGLGIVKRILAGFGAQLSVESALGEGSEFSFRFNVPIVESSELVAEAIEVQSLGAGRGIASSVPESSVPEKHQVQAANSEALQGQLSVLYVEDSEINQAVMEALCEQLPVALEVVDSAKTGYQRISQTRYDVIITDIQMPEFSGVDFLQWFKEDPALNDGVPIYACTANATQEALAGFAREGFSGVLTKPVSLATLEDFFREQLADVEAVKAS